MQTQVLKKQEDKNQQSTAKGSSQNKIEQDSTLEFFDQRPKTSFQNLVQEKANTNARSLKLTSFQEKANVSTKTNQPVQLKKFLEREAPNQEKSNSSQQQENKTGLPDGLKSGIESLSGMAMDDVKVHRNSKKPETLQAHAYAQGTSIHVGPGQEKHLPHEAWHVVQQKQGRVKPTINMNGDVPVNDNQSLEQEATKMGHKAMNFSSQDSAKTPINASIQRPAAQLFKMPKMPAWMEKASGKAKKYYEEEKGYTVDAGVEKENERKGPEFLKGSIGGALGVAGGLVGGTLGGIYGLGKSLTGQHDEVENDQGVKVKKGFFEQIGSSAFNGGKGGRDMGRVAGAGIVDGTKAVAGGAASLALGAAGGVLGAIGGGIYGGVKGAIGNGDRKFTGKKGESNANVKRRSALEQMWESGKKGARSGAKAGSNLGKGGVNAGFGLADETGDVAINATRGVLGAAGGVVGAIGGGIYGGIKGAVGNGDRKFTGKEGESNDNVKRRGVFEQMWKSGKEGAAFGARKGANSKFTKAAIKTGAALGGAAAGGLAGPGGAAAGGFVASSGVETYYGGSRKDAELAGTVSAVAGGVNHLLPNSMELLKSGTASNVAIAGGVTAGSTAADSTLDAAGKVAIDQTKIGPASPKDERSWGKYLSDGASNLAGKARNLPNAAREGIADLGNDVDEEFTLKNKASQQLNRVKKLFGFGKKQK